MNPVRIAVGAALCALGVMHVVGTPPAAHGVDALESGWWWRTAGAPLPAPPVVPEDALWVASAAPNSTGIEAVSAVRFRLGDDEVAPILTLDIVRSTNPLTASLLACPTVGEWEPVHAGAWTSHPTYDCTLGSVAGALSLDGSKVQFDLTTITTSKDIDIVIFAGGAMPVIGVPGSPVPGVPVPDIPPPPGVVDVVVEQPALEAVDIVPIAQQEALVPPVESGAGFDDGTDELVEDVLPFDLPPAAVPNANTGAPAEQQPAAQPVVTRFARFNPPDDDRTARALAGAVFVLLLAWWWRLSVAPTPARARLALGDDPAALPPTPDHREGRPIPLR